MAPKAQRHFQQGLHPFCVRTPDVAASAGGCRCPASAEWCYGQGDPARSGDALLPRRMLAVVWRPSWTRMCGRPTLCSSPVSARLISLGSTGPPRTWMASGWAVASQVASHLLGLAMTGGRNLNTEGEGFEPPKACTLVVLTTASEYETRPRGPLPQWRFHHW